MKRLVIVFFVLLISNSLWSAEVKIALKPLDVNLNNTASLQRGARYFMNYCSGCHSLKYLRYSTMAKGLGLTNFDGSIDSDLLINNLVFTSARPHDPIEIAMPEADARQWFGRLPPDLTLTAREKGIQWIYTFLKSFYKDSSRPFGANNALVPDVSMPNVLASLQGDVIALKDQNDSLEFSHLKLALVENGSMSQQQFDSILHDLVTFLAYAAEPNQLTRYSIGTGVLFFLLIMAVIAYLLKRAYWKNIH